ncbi:MAG: hypothetical protein HYY65_09880 [Candidatus Tectomicrobia bacterium]|uniref:Uncharacterized protein n=1 Tax=Tectimicrobiota bacterium TaxID=2528274 RepID=A0A932GQQ3_UNCTE|nr:hypothetical protein [Candidatus Tectomicrobia bacterium]
MRLWVVKLSSAACYEPSHIEREQSYLQSLASSGTVIELVCPENGEVGQLYARSRAGGGPTGLDFTFLEPFIVRKLKEGEERGFDAAIVHCNSDPGVEAARDMGVSVLDPIGIAVGIAEMCVRLRIRHSRVSYPRPVTLGTADLGMFSTARTNL